MRGPWSLALARARRRPGRWLLSVLGIALAGGFAATVAVEATVAADQSARTVLAGLSPAGRAIRVTGPGVTGAGDRRRVQSLLAPLQLEDATSVLLLNPVRLDGVVVRIAAISPLASWSGRSQAPGSCAPDDCPVLDTGGHLPATLGAAGVSLRVAGSAPLRSAVPLGFVPSPGAPPVLLTGDLDGLASVPGLSGVYRTRTYVGLVPTRHLQSWQLAGFEHRLQRVQSTLDSGAGLQVGSEQLVLTGPFAALDAARQQASAAPRRLLLAGGGALAALALFVILTAGGLRRDQQAELERLRAAGATSAQCTGFVLAEAALVCAAGVLLGIGTALVSGSVLAHASGLPVSAVVSHSLLTPLGLGIAIAGWACATVLVAAPLLLSDLRILDALAVAAVAALALALTRTGTGNDPLPVLLAPLGCLAGGVIVFRLCRACLVQLERVVRRGPPLARMTIVGLARAAAGPALAIAFLAVSTGLGVFALSYHATLQRATAEEAAQQVPLDARVVAGNDFLRPLQVAPLAEWGALARGGVFPVRRTDASFLLGPATTTVTALGVPAAALPELHGWRGGDGSAPLPVLARRLAPPGPVRNPGPALPRAGGWISVTASSNSSGVGVIADLRSPGGGVRAITLGQTSARTRTFRARVPAGGYELEALSLSEPEGEAATNGHQNAENSAAATQFVATLRLGPVRLRAADGRPPITHSVGSWRGVGAAATSETSGRSLMIRFTLNGSSGVIRPAQPSDSQPLPVLTDVQTARGADRHGLLRLSVDGLPITARVVGTLARFPTVPSGGAGFVIADQVRLSAALDAQLPGQGQTDELWMRSRDLAPLRAAMVRSPLSQLAASYRADIEHRLRTAPIARGVLRTLEAAGGLAAALAVLGLMVSLLGADRDARVERDLLGEGMGPRWLRRELRLRLMVAAALGVAAGLGVGAALTRLAVAAVRAVGTVADPQPPVVTVVPWAGLLAWSLALAGVLAVAVWLATLGTTGREAR